VFLLLAFVEALLVELVFESDFLVLEVSDDVLDLLDALSFLEVALINSRVIIVV